MYSPASDYGWAWFDDVKRVKFSALTLEEGSYAFQLVLKDIDLPQNVVLNLTLTFGTTITTASLGLLR